MDTTSTSRAATPPAAPAPVEPLIWDAPVRVFHWLAVLCFAGAYLTAESEHWRLVHVTLGYTLAGLVAFRVAWGLVGTRHARFEQFVRGPAAAAAYLKSLLSGHPQSHAGHNPAGALAIVALLALSAAVAVTGWMTYADGGGDRFEDVHEALANLMLALVGVHLAAVVASSLLHRENLVRAMFTGRKMAQPSEGIQRARYGTAILLLAGVLGFWWVQWQDAPRLDVAGHHSTATQGEHRGGHDSDSDGGDRDEDDD